jgi:hypothetical protein
MALLRKVFGDSIISTNIWSPRSPDLTPPDFYLWGALKNAAYKDDPCSPGDLKKAFTDFFESIPCTELVRVFDSKVRRADACLKVREDYFQQLL